MNDQLRMSHPETLPDTPNATSSLESACGATPCVKQDGVTRHLSGPEVARANLSPRQAKALGLMTSGTFGLHGSTSSNSADLTLSLANRLKRRSSILGSTLFNLTWKESATPLGRRVFRLVASVPRTSVNASSLLEQKSWPTPTRNDSLRVPSVDFKTPNITLNHAALMVQAPWPTPVANDDKSPEAHMRMKERMGGNRTAITSLQVMLKCVIGTWVTPSARDWKDTPGMATTGTDPDGTTRQRLDQLPRQAAQMDFGATQIGFHSVTGKSARLNPALSRWLQGLPQLWDDCAPTAIPSVARSRKSSSART